MYCRPRLRFAFFIPALLGASAASATWSVAGTTLAAPRKERADEAAIDNAKHLMASGERAQVEAGIQSLGLLGKPAAVVPLAERIRQGLPPDLLETAIVTLMALGQPSAGPVLHELMRHRRPEIRLRTVEALVAVEAEGTAASLSGALSDSDPQVRAAAAAGLGEIGARSALPRLFLALDHGNLAASGAIGKLVPAEDVDRLLGYLGKMPFHSVGPALGEVLERKDIGEQTKLRVVARLGELATAEVKGFFGDVLAEADDTLSKRVTRAILQSMQRIPD